MRWVNAVRQDVQFGMRQLRRNPGFTAAAVIVLGLGIGANTAIFSVVNGVLLRALPLPHSERLVRMWHSDADHPGWTGPASYPNLIDWRRQSTAFTGIAAYLGGSYNLKGASSPARVAGVSVSANFFQVLGVEPRLGRGFTPQEEQPGRSQVAVISESLWRGQFGSSPNIIGQTISLNERPYTVIGVAPADFPFPYAGTDIWVPFELSAATMPCYTVRGCNTYSVIARLKPGITLAAARAQMNTIAARLSKQYPDSDYHQTVKMQPLEEAMVGGIQPELLVFLAAVGFVFLLALANVASLLLTRTAARQREIALRVALGAGRWRLIGQFLSESLLIAAGGAIVGWFLALWGVSLLQQLKPGDLPRLEAVHLDWRVLLFTIAVAVVAAVVLGAAMALKASRFRIYETLKEAGPASTAARGRRRSGDVLVVAEFAISLVLLAGAGLMIKSFWHIEQVRYGIEVDHVLTMRLSLPQSKYGPKHPTSAFYQPLLEKVDALPGVRSSGIVTLLPVQQSWTNGDFEIHGQKYSASNSAPEAEIRAASAGFYAAMGIPLVRGRFFSADDTAAAPPVVVINQTLARRYFHGKDPIGQQLEIGGGLPWFTVVGIAGDVKQAGYHAPVQAELDVPYTQWPPTWPDMTRDMSLVVRTVSNPDALAGAVRHAVFSIDPDQPIFRVETMRQVVNASMAQPRFEMILLAAFAALALVLASVGIYGVLAYSVKRRTQEIGIRMALGAQRGDVLKLVVRYGMTLALIGVAIGLAGAFALTRFLASLLYHVRPIDLPAFAAVSAILIGVAFLATFIPARRAAKVDPMVALRYE